MITIYRIINLKTGEITHDTFFFLSDAQEAMRLVAHPYIHEIYSEEYAKISTQTVNLTALTDVRKNDRLTVYQLNYDGKTLVGMIKYFGAKHPVAYDPEFKIWRVVVPVLAVA